MSGMAIRMRVHGGKPAVTSLQVAESFGKTTGTSCATYVSFLNRMRTALESAILRCPPIYPNKIKNSPCIS